MRISNITKEDKIKWWQGNLFEEDLIELAMTKAYRDLMRTIRSFATNINNNRIKTNARICIKEYINKMIKANITTQKQFDILHQEACENLIENFEDQYFTIGQAQKWINMTFKYLHLLECEDIKNIYEFCHIPIDSYMLHITNYQMSKPWSKLNDYTEYLQYQEWFRNKYKDEIPLDAEFHLWLEEAKKSRKH
ncbi:MAG: hypothetical protein IJA94_04240 [Bacilli bacterium]|nr:hypothetical protein [Bacilli bacterium]